MPEEPKGIPFRIIHSSRRTISLQVSPDGVVVVRAPYRTGETEIRQILQSKRSWIERALQRQKTQKENRAGIRPLNQAEAEQLKKQAKAYFAGRIAFFEPLVGVKATRLSIRLQKTKWGSCTKDGHVSLNALLLLAPPEVSDSVVVHELCHLLHMNHSPAFYREVRRVYPDYDVCHDWLRRNGALLQARLPQNSRS